MKEEWKDVVGYEGLYQVSDLGNVFSVRSNRLMSLTPDKKAGYFRVCLTKNKKGSNCQVHQLLAMAFLNHKPNGINMVVDHIDNDKTNNKLSNLQIVKHRYNCSKDRSGYSSRYVGVTWRKSVCKWRSQIQVNGKNLHLGLFDCELKAAIAYNNKLKQIQIERD